MFNDDAGVSSSDDEAWYLSGRIAWAPIMQEQTTFHVGVSGGHREPDQNGERFDFDSRAENAIQSTDSVSANFANADSADTYGLEAALVYGPFSLQGEYFFMDADRNGGNSDLEFDGAYVQASYFLTGERRPYSAKNGAFGRVAPKAPFDIRKGDWGAWELAARYSTIDVSDNDVLGGEMDNYTVGLNWYLSKNARIMANYISVDTDENAVTPNDDPEIILLRTQVDF
jgi:phosphate-selective porin OprO/OprP